MNDHEARIVLLEALVKQLLEQTRYQDNQMEILGASFKRFIANVYGDDTEDDLAWDDTTLH